MFDLIECDLIIAAVVELRRACTLVRRHLLRILQEFAVEQIDGDAGSVLNRSGTASGQLAQPHGDICRRLPGFVTDRGRRAPRALCEHGREERRKKFDRNEEEYRGKRGPVRPSGGSSDRGRTLTQPAPELVLQPLPRRPGLELRRFPAGNARSFAARPNRDRR